MSTKFWFLNTCNPETIRKQLADCPNNVVSIYNRWSQLQTQAELPDQIVDFMILNSVCPECKGTTIVRNTGELSFDKEVERVIYSEGSSRRCHHCNGTGKQPDDIQKEMERRYVYNIRDWIEGLMKSPRMTVVRAAAQHIMSLDKISLSDAFIRSTISNVLLMMSENQAVARYFYRLDLESEESDRLVNQVRNYVRLYCAEAFYDDGHRENDAAFREIMARTAPLPQNQRR